MNGKKWKIILQKYTNRCMIGILILLTVFCSGCGKGSSRPQVVDEESALSMLRSLESYEAQVQITFYSNKGENTYLVHQQAMASGPYRMEILEPENFAGVQTISDGQRVVQTDPTIGGEVEAKQTPVRDALLLYAFVEAYAQGGSLTEGENDTLILSASYPEGHRKIVSAQLTLAKGSGVPLSLEIQDGENKPSIHMTYQSFQMNPELSEENFKIASQL